MIHNPSARDASATEWFKSSYSDSSSGNNCVEVAIGAGAIRVRDSKNAHGPLLTLEPGAWADFMSYTSGS